MKYRSFPLGKVDRHAVRRPERRAGPGPISVERAQALAVAALAFLAADQPRIERFLTTVGLNVYNLREIADSPGFLAGVLDHLAQDEPLLLAFCGEAGHDPLTIMQARNRLGGPSAWDST